MTDLPRILPENDHNRTLVNNVHPPAWINPEPAPIYNLVVIGAGTAGLITAAGAAGLGARVALVERHLMGGDCLNVGCVPSKGIIRAAHAFHEARHTRAFGVSGGDRLAIDFGAAMQRMQAIRAGISAHDSARRYSEELGVDVFFGRCRFSDPGTIEVEGKTLRFKRAAICTGARAAVPPIPGLEEVGYLTNETVFSLTELPKRLAVIGAGPIGCELAQTFARLGSKVTLLETQERILRREEEDAALVVQKAFQREGIEICFHCRGQKAFFRDGEKVLVHHDEELVVDEILVGVGRAPNVEGLDLAKAGVDYDDKNGVKVDERLQTTNPDIYAAGDICTPYKFTHTADAMARILIANALFMGRQKTSDLVIPWCTYTDPEIAHVGIYPEQVEETGHKITTLTVPLDAVDRARLDGEVDGYARVYLQQGSDRILGATIVARHAGEMIGELCLAMTSRLGLKAIGRTIHPYPTQAEAVKKLADAYNRSRLTPLVAKALGGWLRWQRRIP